MNREAGQLRGVLKLSVEGAQIHWQQVVFRESGTLRRQEDKPLQFHKKTSGLLKCSFKSSSLFLDLY